MISYNVNDLSLILPIYNEEARLKKNLKEIKKFISKNKNIEIIFINDGSNDNSNIVIEKFISKINNNKIIQIISYKKNIGKGYAIKKGVLTSKKKWVLICDTDMSVKPNQINNWSKKKYITDNKCAYFASRKHSLSKVKTSKIREFLGKIFNVLIYCLFDIRIKDTQCGFKLFHNSYAKKVFNKISSYRFSFDVELVLILSKYKIGIKELPVNWTHKTGSKLNIFFDMPIMFFDILKIKFKNN